MTLGQTFLLRQGDVPYCLSIFIFFYGLASLHTNIDIDEGLPAVRKIYQKYPDPKRPDEELLELLDINLRLKLLCVQQTILATG